MGACQGMEPLAKLRRHSLLGTGAQLEVGDCGDHTECGKETTLNILCILEICSKKTRCR